MFIQNAPMDRLAQMNDGKWVHGDRALDLLRSIIKECMTQKIIKKGDVEKLLKKAQAQCTVTAWEVNLQDRKKTFKDPKDPKITYTIKKTGISQGRGVYDIIYLVPRH